MSQEHLETEKPMVRSPEQAELSVNQMTQDQAEQCELEGKPASIDQHQAEDEPMSQDQGEQNAAHTSKCSRTQNTKVWQLAMYNTFHHQDHL